VTLATPPFRKLLEGSCDSCPDCPWKHARQILKSVALIVLKLLTFNHQTFRGHVT